MDKKLILSAITPDVEALGAFIVDVTVSAANDIEIIIEKDTDSVRSSPRTRKTTR